MNNLQIIQLSARLTKMAVLILVLGTMIPLPTHAALDATSFAAKVDFAVSERPWGMASGDIDGDGKLDLVVSIFGPAGSPNNTVSVLRNTSTAVGTISFAAPATFTVGTGPAGVALSDLDGDGKLDVITANYGSANGNTISVLRNTSSVGNISFESAIPFTVGNGPRFLAAGDLDGDNKPDLAVANFGAAPGALGNTISLLRNTSSGTTINFATTTLTMTSGLGPLDVVIQDFDGDGKRDLATTIHGNNDGTSVAVWRNTSSMGSIAFATQQNFAVGYGPNGLAAGYIDDDNKLDLVATNFADNLGNSTGNTVSVLQNTSVVGTISFAGQVTFTTGTAPYYVALRDLDGDNKPDLAVTNFSNDNVSVLQNTSVGASIAFAPKVDFVVGTTPFVVVANDFDSDSKPELATSNNSSVNVSVLRNQSSPYSVNFGDKTDIAVGTNPFGIAPSDLDGDTRLDLAVTNYSGANVSVLRNTGNGAIGSVTFSSSTWSVGTGPRGIVISDFDLDGKLDIAAANLGISPSWGNTISVLRNTSTGSGSISFGAAIPFTVGTGPMSIVAGDFDGDGDPDLAVTNSGGDGTGNTISILQNTSSTPTISFTTLSPITVGNGPWGIAAGDLDGDGKLDLVVANASSNNVSVLRNTSTGGTISFVAQTPLTMLAGTFPLNVVLSDLDGDGKRDVIVTNYGNGSGSTVSVWRNNSSGVGNFAFAAQLTFTTGAGPRGLAVGDMGGDSKPDLAITNYGGTSNTVSVLRNISTMGNIAFASRADFTTASGPINVIVGPLDGDGKLDIATANYNSNNVSVLLSTTNKPTAVRLSSFSASRGTSDALLLIALSAIGMVMLVAAGGTSFGKTLIERVNVFQPEIKLQRKIERASIACPLFVQQSDEKFLNH